MTDENLNYGQHNVSTLRIRVLYADTDKMGIVYHANYFRWFEAGRGKYMRTRGLPYTQTEQSGVQLPLVEAGIKYHKPATYEDIIEINTWVSGISSVVVKFGYEIKKEGELLVTGFTHHAAINRDSRPTRVPDRLIAALNSQESIPDPVL
jgi:acyl-CoA thioester hydrolase